MAKRERMSHVRMGDAYPAVSHKDFTTGATRRELREVWPVIGPTVERNMYGRRPAELWELFALCYLQGLENGHSLAGEQTSRG